MIDESNERLKRIAAQLNGMRENQRAMLIDLEQTTRQLNDFRQAQKTESIGTKIFFVTIIGLLMFLH